MILRVTGSHAHRKWFGTVELENGLVLYTTGCVASWLFEGDEVEVAARSRPKDVLGRETLFFDDYDLYRIYDGERVKVWGYFRKEVVLSRKSLGREIYSYRILAREAVFERDFEAIAELEQYHYASQKSKVALWRCEGCGKLLESNIKPSCDCGGEVHIVEIKGSTPASRFLVFELADRQPFEPEIVAYVRVDPPVPSMHRRLGDEVVKNIRKLVFPEDWFENVFAPEEEMKELFQELRRKHSLKVARHKLWEVASRRAMMECNSAASRIARVVVHPDYRADGIGRLAVEIAAEWIAERRVPEMRRRKHLVEVIAQMARFNPFFEKAGFYYMWDTASGKPVLYRPLSDEAEQHIKRFLESDEEGRRHGGRLCVSRYGRVEPLRKLRFERVSKVFSTQLDVERVSEDVRFVLESFGVRQRVVERYVFRDLSLDVRPGEVLAVVGASGSGKTTLLKMILGLERPTSGSVEVEAGEVACLIPGEVEPEIDGRCVIEHVYGVCGDIYLAVEVLNTCGISDAVLYRARYHELSTGQKERFKLAMLLARRPSLLLVDEFAAHLDEVTAMRVARKVSEIARRAGITLIAVTHRKEVISALSPDRILYVGYGGVMAEENRN
ncbi:ABC-type ATPase fused to a predicted acetyltransferase domain [Geoglobus ahangari]|uniref:ABC-type ATPase fused to a predicted acetyltransferase domain n=1 Tax=Geoglobus ahangari TaxID=113653 RepID=A0A0F7ICK7_9EURY|nr:ATP-binding cassette domain-containing protein [Geoglobus ahangari]AKG91014.1 ABC-type ATPase fused to a predicted acetyltransferase domain [Geoglobus ahangari]